jgi:hypothetical protein
VEQPFRAAIDRSQQAALAAEGLHSSGAKAQHSERDPSAGLKPCSTRPTGSVITVAGYLYARDFPDVVHELRAGGRSMLGMSYEIADARVAEFSAPIWTITQFTFTGAALLRRDKAAYRDTWIELT